MSRSGFPRTWIGLRPAMQAWRHLGGPVIQLLLNSRKMFTFARHSVHLVTYCVFRVVVMMLSMIAGLHTIALTSVASTMNILVKRRNVVSGMSHYMATLTLLTNSQCWAFRATCVCQKNPALGHPTHKLVLHRCAVDVHLCGEPCKLSGKKGCLVACIKV